jgi:hypothetical protein
LVRQITGIHIRQITPNKRKEKGRISGSEALNGNGIGIRYRNRSKWQHNVN